MNGNSRNAGTAEQRGEILLDVIGQRCPLPVLRARKRLLRLEPGQLVRVFASDPVARIERTAFAMTGEAIEWRVASGRADRFRYRSRIG